MVGGWIRCADALVGYLGRVGKQTHVSDDYESGAQLVSRGSVVGRTRPVHSRKLSTLNTARSAARIVDDARR